jgi:hypothetical protein
MSDGARGRGSIAEALSDVLSEALSDALEVRCHV